MGLVVVMLLFGVLGAGLHAATWVPDEAVLRRQALELPATPIAAAQRGELVRLEGQIVGPVEGASLESPVARRACVAFSLEAEGLATVTRGVDFLLESEGARARITSARLELGLAGELHGRREGSGRLDAFLDRNAPTSTARTAVERTLTPGRRVAIVGYVTEREPDPDAAPVARGDGYRAVVRPTRPVIGARGMAVLVVDPPSPTEPINGDARPRA